MSARVWFGTLIVWMSIVCGCSGRRDATFPGDDAQTGWAPVIASHTTGVVPRKADVHVIFAVDVAPAATAHGRYLGQSGDERILTLNPSVDGTVSFAGPRELVFEPKKGFEPGLTYTVRVHPQRLLNVRQDLSPFEFSFHVQTPQFEVALQGLESDAANDQLMSLRGTLTAADLEEASKLEQIVAVSYLGKLLPLQWAHGADGLTHTFSSRGIQRQRGAQPLLIRWDGRPIGAGANGQQTLEVPARGRFLVTEERATEVQGRRQIVVHFADNLATRQDLTGLVRLSQGQFSSRIERNTLTIYPEADTSGEVVLTLEAGIRNERGDRLEEALQKTLVFTSTKPQVRFVGRGVILPDGATLTIPFEAVSARSVRVTALRVYDENISQFLQVNKLDGNAEMGRVGRFLWRKTIPLAGPVTGRWTRYDLDVTELMRKYPGGMFQLTLQLTPADSAYPCDAGTPPEAQAQRKAVPLGDQDDGDQIQASNWDYAQEYFDVGGGWSHRADPCHASYYLYGTNVRAVRNLIASNVGLLAKRDQHGKIMVTATDLRTSKPLSGVNLTLRNFQNRPLTSATTDANGFATLTSPAAPFLLVGESGDQRSYLKLNAGSALPTSHFDVGGDIVAKGIKGFLYADRGVWRPGDSIHVVLVVQDKDGTLPSSHPVTLELYDPRGRLVQTLTNTAPVGRFYRFDLKTAPDAPTGDWTAKALLGELTFSTRLKVETVMPNRLKVDLDVTSETLTPARPVHGAVAAQWLSGATAAGLKTDVKLALAPTATRFGRFADYVFDDVAREFAMKSETIFEGSLDNNGRATFDTPVQVAGSAPGMLSALFTTRVFERGGAFSINRQTTTYAPYARFVGIRLPKGDAARDMLITDQQHTIEIATLSAAGEAASSSQIQVTLYKVEWKWWWDKTGESLAQYVRGNSNTVIREDVIATDAQGQGQWKFEIKYPEWGRYLVRACDLQGGHCAGRTFYIDWPSWAGKEREQSGPAASVLAITADRARYAVGDTATLQLPESAHGRALVTIESGTDIIDMRWLEPTPGHTRFTVPITAAMAPNVYVAVTLIQPHEKRDNDRPIRLYGVIPLEVSDPQTHLTPSIKSADEWKPESHGHVEVTEVHGHAMTYTLAVVDEGLLTLTSYRTPNPYDYFYRKEALGVTTWDLFDDVAGAYGAELERLLALGGSDAPAATNPDEARSRFPPVVRFLGPFHLEGGATGSHQIDLPRYIGAVRVMVVAGERGAYGSAEKSVFVRQPLMLLPTMPRVVGPGESVAVPVSVFVSDTAIKDVTLAIEPDKLFTPVGKPTTEIAFARPEEQVGVLYLKAANRLGKSHVRLTAASGAERAESDVFIEVRNSNPPTVKFETRALQPGESWSARIVPHGLPGTNTATLEVSSLPALNLDSRLGYLIQYPHGCLEQTTSSVFPQLYLSSLVKLEDGRKQEIEDNVRNGIERLRWFQLSNGGFSYWPGGSGGFADGSLEHYDVWASTYASHFLLEAEKAGYALPPTMRSGVIRHLKTVAEQWTPNSGSTLDQAYRLYVLALAGEADVGAMNRMREAGNLPTTERWILAAAYKLAGLGELASSLGKGDPLAFNERPRRGPDYTFGSPLRDRAMVLQSMAVLGRLDRSAGLVKDIAAELTSQRWYSTQSVAYSLLAIAKIAGAGDPGTFDFEQSIGGKVVNVTAHSPVYQTAMRDLPDTGTPLEIHNTSQRVLFVTVATQGVPEVGKEEASSSGLAVDVTYTDEDGKSLDIEHVRQGADLIAHVEVKNSTSLRIDNIALTQIFAAGWEIHNDRLDIPDGSHDATATRVDYTDIRDDRVLQYFGLPAGDSIRFSTRLNAAYRGRYYQPGVLAEAMYDATSSAHTQGRWVEVTPATH